MSSARRISPSVAVRRDESSRMSRRAVCRPKIFNCCCTFAQADTRPAPRGVAAAMRSIGWVRSSSVNARGVRRVFQQARRHLLVRGLFQIGRQQRQRQAIRFAGITLFEERHVLRQRMPRVEPRLQLGRRRHAARAQTETARHIVQRTAMLLDGEAAMQAQRLGGDFGGDVGVAIPIAADPRREREPARRDCSAADSAAPARCSRSA